MKLYLAMQRDYDQYGSDQEVGVFDELEKAQAACGFLQADESDRPLEWEETKSDDGLTREWTAEAYHSHTFEIMLVDVNKRLMATTSEWKVSLAENRARHKSSKPEYTDEQRAEDERIILEYESEHPLTDIHYARFILPSWFVVKD